MQDTGRNAWKLRAVAALIFLLGAAAGLLAPRAFYAWTRGGDGGGQRPRAEFGRMLDRLDLTSEQRSQVQQILSETREQFRALRRETRPREDDIRRRADERLRQVFTPDQWQQFQKLMAERRGPRRARPGKGDGTPPPAEQR